MGLTGGNQALEMKAGVRKEAHSLLNCHSCSVPSKVGSEEAGRAGQQAVSRPGVGKLLLPTWLVSRRGLTPGKADYQADGEVGERKYKVVMLKVTPAACWEPSPTPAPVGVMSPAS